MIETIYSILLVILAISGSIVVMFGLGSLCVVLYKIARDL